MIARNKPSAAPLGHVRFWEPNVRFWERPEPSFTFALPANWCACPRWRVWFLVDAAGLSGFLRRSTRWLRQIAHGRRGGRPARWAAGVRWRNRGGKGSPGWSAGGGGGGGGGGVGAGGSSWPSKM